MQNLKFYQSLWAMEQRIPNKPELPIRENFQKISRAGFDGVCLDLGIHELDEFRKTKALFEEFNLGCMVNVFPSKPEHLLPSVLPAIPGFGYPYPIAHLQAAVMRQHLPGQWDL